jgi:glycosyltransferase involved in cell wall biosynthesis
MSELARSVHQLDTHWNLVSRTEQREPDIELKLDAIIVPASRPAQNLEEAITLAQAMRCTLLILCSRRVEPTEVQELLAERSCHDAIVVGLPDNYRHELLDFRALATIKDDLPPSSFYRVRDLSTKRNLGLILARMLGWQRIFFLDDDIRDVNPADVHSTVSMLGSYPAAGMRVAHYPDNSVVCHAHRMTGGSQDVFVTGAALAVDCQQSRGFFPDIYNEDWLFFYDMAADGRLGSSRREVTQVRYDPFADPQRAAWQEFGDVLAEGLYALLEFGVGIDDAEGECWSYFLDSRRRFFDAIGRRSDEADPEIRERLLRSVEAARECSAEIAPELFEQYIRLWRQDLRDWEQRIDGMRRMPSLHVALQALGLARSADGRAAAHVARPRSADAAEEPSTVPFDPLDCYGLFTRG